WDRPAVDDRCRRGIEDRNQAPGRGERLREMALPLQERGHRERESGPRAQPLAFVREKEERLVLLDRAAYRAAVDVVAQLRRDSLAVAVDGGEEPRCVQRIVA